jgi:phosphoglycerate dehydrogenase-like enzyme
MSETKPRVAILDDYNHAAMAVADWTELDGRCRIDVIDRPLAVPEEAAQVLEPYHVLCHLRERTAMPRVLIERLPNLKFMTVTGRQHRTLDLVAATERGVIVSADAARPSSGSATAEMTWGLILALARNISREDRALRAGRWQETMGVTLAGRTLGLVGLGRVGSVVARIGQAFGMTLVAWSQNMTEVQAAACGARLVTKDELFRVADIVSLHLVLGERSRGVVGARELGLMKPTAYLVNTSRGPLIDEAALLNVLRGRRIAGAGLDVYWSEPLARDHPLVALDNVVITPHLGYVVQEVFANYYADTVEGVRAWLDGSPIRVLNPEVFGGAGREGPA